VEAIVLGSAAGGGVPQWNCRCPICELARAGDPRVSPRTQSSLALSADGENWLVVNASPDLRQQIAETRALHPRHGARHSPISAVLLTNGDVDHVAGLLTMRENQPFKLYATQGVLKAVDDNRIFGVCNPDFVPRVPVVMGETFEPVPGLRAELFTVPGKIALWLEDETMKIGESTENTVGLEITAGGKRLLYIPGCAAITPEICDRIRGADALLFDGTLWHENEMIEQGLMKKTGSRMGHLSMSGPGGTIAALSAIDAGRKVFVHINNSNPVLDSASKERAAANAAGWETGYDGMEIRL
jgi:pyrroloquinoline quinone biosynthesis protein B